MTQSIATSERNTWLSPRLSAVAGIAVPVIFLTTVALLTWFKYDYMVGLGWSLTEEHAADISYPSGLALGPFGWVQSANFLLAGLLALVLLAGLRSQFSGRWSGRLATILLSIFGVAGLLNAIPMSMPGDGPTVWDLLHAIGFFMTMVGGIFGILAAGLALRRNPAWRGWWLYSVLTTVGLLLAFFNFIGMPGYTSFYVVLVLLFGWFGVIGVRLYQLSSFTRTSLSG